MHRLRSALHSLGAFVGEDSDAQAPFRLGGQSFLDLVEEADLCFVSNVVAHAPLAAKVLVTHDANILESLQLATEGVEGQTTWSKCVIEALEDVKSTKLESLGLGRWF